MQSQREPRQPPGKGGIRFTPRSRQESSDSVPAEHVRLELEDGLAFEGSIKSMPRLARSRPSDRAARRKILEGRLRDAQAKVSKEVASPLAHGRCCLLGLLVVEVIRTAAWWQGTIPGWSVFGMHFLTTSSDIACILCAVPLYSIGIRGQCVQLGCLGPMLTLVFAMCLVDLSALGAYLVVATPRPLSPGARSYVDALEACVGVWEFALVASVAFQMALCSSSWRVYKELRVIGLYPPGSDPATIGELRPVSVMEVMCEAEDVELLADCEVGCDASFTAPLMGTCPGSQAGQTGQPTHELVDQVPARATPMSPGQAGQAALVAPIAAQGAPQTSFTGAKPGDSKRDVVEEPSAPRGLPPPSYHTAQRSAVLAAGEREAVRLAAAEAANACALSSVEVLTFGAEPMELQSAHDSRPGFSYA